MSHDLISFSALMGIVHWNMHTHQSKTIKGMGWSIKLLQNNCWRFFVCLLLPPEILCPVWKKTVLHKSESESLSANVHPWIGKFAVGPKKSQPQGNYDPAFT